MNLSSTIQMEETQVSFQLKSFEEVKSQRTEMELFWIIFILIRDIIHGMCSVFQNPGFLVAGKIG